VYFGGGVEIAYLPYLSGGMDADDARRLHGMLAEISNGRNIETVLHERLRERSRFAERLRVYVFSTGTELDRKDKVLDEAS
jgi:hypothetical protein